MVKYNCPKCGKPLLKTTLDRYFCPNDGIFERQEIEREDRLDDSTPNYIG